MSMVGALIGGLAGIGALLIVAGWPWAGPPSLDQRLAPYLRGSLPNESDRTFDGSSGGASRAVVKVFLEQAYAWAGRISGGNGSVDRRLRRLNSPRSVEQFRAQQVLCGAAGALVGALVAVVSAAGSGGGVVPLVGLVVIGTLIGMIGRDQFLDWQVRRREDRILNEFPAVADILALAVGAGEGPLAALERVSQTCVGDLPDEISRMLADSRTGHSLADALNALAERIEIVSLARFVDGIVVALERGTPLGDVLRAQAQDVRELTKRRLMESGGRREIGAMVPVVFLILPVTVVFALYPGLAVLDISV